MRKFIFAMLAVFSLMVTGCGEKETPTPPAGADTAETPDIDIEAGIEVPGEGDTSEEDTTSNTTGKDAEG